MLTTNNYLMLLNNEKALKEEMEKLSQLIEIYAPHDGGFSLNIPGIYVGRDSKIDVDIMKNFYMPSIGIIAQGAKAIMAGKEIYQCDYTHMHFIPIALPVSLRTTDASSSKPSLGIRLDLDPKRIAELVMKVYPQGLPSAHKWSASYVTQTDVNIINAMRRMLECLQKPGDTEFIAPLILDEILIRLLRSPIGVHVAEIGLRDSDIQQVTGAINWLRENFAQTMKVSDLAELVHMSVSSFHEHFKAVTSMSPLQYQKVLRLHEARHLMLSKNINAATACQLVGYLSDSQFNRDYGNYFGNPPKRDIAKLRKLAQK
jgi:AraC-like DNA-binding protein